MAPGLMAELLVLVKVEELNEPSDVLKQKVLDFLNSYTIANACLLNISEDFI